MVHSQTITRLSRDALTSPSYEKLAKAIFGADNWESHLRYCRWLYEENPSVQADEPLPLYVCRDGDDLVGQLGVIPCDVMFWGAPLRAGWCIDTFVLPSHQRKRIGTRLLRAAWHDFPLLMALGGANAGYEMGLKLGWQAAGTLVWYKRFLRPLRCIPKRVMQTIGLARTARSLPGVPAVARYPVRHDVEVEAITSFTELGSEQRDLHGSNETEARICRTPAFMQWRYFENPLLEYSVRRLRLRPYGEVHAVWRLIDNSRWRTATLVDLVYADDVPAGALATVARVVMECMRADGAELFECQTSDPGLLSALRDRLFSKRERGMRLVYGAENRQVLPRITCAQWHLYTGDSDADCYAARRGQP